MAAGTSSSLGAGAGALAACAAGFTTSCAHAHARIASSAIFISVSSASLEPGRDRARKLAVQERRLVHVAIRIRLVFAHVVLRLQDPFGIDARLLARLDGLGE